MVSTVKKVTSLARLIRRAFHNYGRSFVIIVILGFIGGLFEGFGIAAVIPLFYVATGQQPAESNTIAQVILDGFSFIGIPATVTAVLSLIVGLFIAKGIVQFVVRHYNARIVAKFEEGFRKTAFRRTLRADWPFLMKQKSGYLETVLLYDTERGTAIMNVLATMILVGTTFAAYSLIAINISVSITLTTLVIGAGIFFALKPVFYRIRRLVSAQSGFQKDFAHHIAEHQASLKSIKAMSVENPVIEFANDLFAKVRDIRVQTSFLNKATQAAIEPLGFIVIAVLFLLHYQQPAFDIASFAVIIFLVQRMFTYVRSISGQLQSINEMSPYLRHMMRWRRDTKANEEADAGTKNFSFQNELAFEHVDFSYRDERPVLSDFSFVIPRGQLVGVVGPSGIGKTTVIDLMLRLFEPSTGRITVDGTDAKDIRLASWRSHFGYVPQDGVLLDTSIRENIRFYSQGISDDDIVRAARRAHIHDTIMDLPEGYDTMAGERGVNLSGGQRQRILLARALARKPDVLILDEATSSVDKESQRLIHEAITALAGDTTVIVITHDPEHFPEIQRRIQL